MKRTIILFALLILSAVNLYSQIGFPSFGFSIPLVGSLPDYKIEKNGGSFRYENIIELLNYGRLKNKFDDLYIPYIKFTIGLRYDNIYLGSGNSLSFYFNYDFPKVRVRGVEPDKQRLSSIDLGVQIGFHFSFFEMPNPNGDGLL